MINTPLTRNMCPNRQSYRPIGSLGLSVQLYKAPRHKKCPQIEFLDPPLITLTVCLQFCLNNGHLQCCELGLALDLINCIASISASGLLPLVLCLAKTASINLCRC